MKKETGLTKDAGFQMGIRKTFPMSVGQVWELLFSEAGIKLWLGNLKDLKWEKNEEYQTSEGTEGKVRIFKLYSHIRITWKKKEWHSFSTLQIRTIKSKEKTVISFHQDRLISTVQREEMLVYWENVLNNLNKIIK
jgi:uncharacterized protein YndB with AHSA1/START domain